MLLLSMGCLLLRSSTAFVLKFCRFSTILKAQFEFDMISFLKTSVLFWTKSLICPNKSSRIFIWTFWLELISLMSFWGLLSKSFEFSLEYSSKIFEMPWIYCIWSLWDKMQCPHNSWKQKLLLQMNWMGWLCTSHKRGFLERWSLDSGCLLSSIGSVLEIFEFRMKAWIHPFETFSVVKQK